LIFYSEIALLKWLFEDLGMDFVNLHVFSNNILTLKLHKSVGFEEINRKPLYKTTDKAGYISYTIKNTEDFLEAALFEYVEMGMGSSLFRTLYPTK
jgi:RimJ/RimL family protein N-acetyltransferase